MLEYVLAAGIFSQDVVTKQIVREKIKEREERPFLKGKVVLTKVFNDGAMLGLLRKHPDLLKSMTLLALGVLIGALAGEKPKECKSLRRIGLALMLGGAASNAYERLLYGKVTDYIRFDAGPEKFRKLVFNTGDFAVFIGSILTASAR